MRNSAPRQVVCRSGCRRPQKNTLNKNFEFQRAYKHGKSKVEAAVVVYALPQRFGLIRVGITSSKKIGCAVERNRARRVVRAAWHPLKPHIVGAYDIVLVCRSAAVRCCSTEQQRQLAHAVEALGLIRE